MREDKSQWDVITLEGLKQAAKKWMMVIQGQNRESLIASFTNMKISPEDVLKKIRDMTQSQEGEMHATKEKKR
jgi:hypothetical protein